jgi:FlaA1/EpsC-like NDP-sugar epimerase
MVPMQAIYTLDMGEPVSIRLLAEQMIRLAGKHPGKDVSIVYTGLRPGEKLHETLFHADERYRPTAHPKILQAEARDIVDEHIDGICRRMQQAVAAYDVDVLRALLRESVPEFSPHSDKTAAQAATVVAFPGRSIRHR